MCLVVDMKFEGNSSNYVFCYIFGGFKENLKKFLKFDDPQSHLYRKWLFYHFLGKVENDDFQNTTDIVFLKFFIIYCSQKTLLGYILSHPTNGRNFDHS